MEMLDVVYKAGSLKTHSSNSNSNSNSNSSNNNNSNNVTNTKLIDTIDNIFITTLGLKEDINDGKQKVLGRLETYETTAINRRKVRFVLSGKDKFLWEFPTLALMQVGRGRSLSLTLKGLFLYTVGILFHMVWCIRQLWCPSIIICSITSIAYNYHTDIYPL